MQIATVGTYQVGLGTLIALVAFIVVVVMLVLSMIDVKLGLLIAALALARLL